MKTNKLGSEDTVAYLQCSAEMPPLGNITLGDCTLSLVRWKNNKAIALLDEQRKYIHDGGKTPDLRGKGC